MSHLSCTLHHHRHISLTIKLFIPVLSYLINLLIKCNLHLNIKLELKREKEEGEGANFHRMRGLNSILRSGIDSYQKKSSRKLNSPTKMWWEHAIVSLIVGHFLKPNFELQNRRVAQEIMGLLEEGSFFLYIRMFLSAPPYTKQFSPRHFWIVSFKRENDFQCSDDTV